MKDLLSLNGRGYSCDNKTGTSVNASNFLARNCLDFSDWAQGRRSLINQAFGSGCPSRECSTDLMVSKIKRFQD